MLTRDQRIALFLQRHLKLRSKSHVQILEVGPSLDACGLLTDPTYIGNARYTAIDVNRTEAIDMVKPPNRAFEMDVCDMAFSNASFDVVICNHVLPFVSDYRQALMEIRRILKPSGVAILQTALPLEITAPANVSLETEPQLFTYDVLENVGTHWHFGRDFFAILRSAGWIPMRYPQSGSDIFLGFKNTAGEFFRELSPLRLMANPMNDIKIDTKPTARTLG